MTSKAFACAIRLTLLCASPPEKTYTIYKHDELMQFRSQLPDFVSLKNGFYSFRAQAD